VIKPFSRSGKDRGRREMFALCCAALVSTVALVPRSPGGSWKFFAKASELLGARDQQTGSGLGLHLYAKYPQAQFGPVSVVAARMAIYVSPKYAVHVAQVVSMFSYVLILLLVHNCVLRSRPQQDHKRAIQVLVVSGAVLLPVWIDLAIARIHIDDVLAITGVVLAIWALIAKHPYVGAIAVGVAADAKPWAVVFLLVLLIAEPNDRWPAFGLALSFAFFPWIPFILGDTHTLASLTHFTISNNQSSPLRALGVQSPRTPRWDRPVQLLLGTGFGIGAVVRRRWEGVLLMGVAGRLLIEPGTNHYYVAGLAVGALVWDSLAGQGRLPWMTLWTVTLFEVPNHVAFFSRHVVGLLRVAACLGAVVYVVLRPSREDGWEPSAIAKLRHSV
jgi:hypothetical protein